MTLPNEKLLALLARDFVVGWKDIRKEDFCGVSRGYTKNQTAVGTTNGAGGRNVQVFVLTPNARVLLALPGFWHADDLRTELQFAKVLNRLWLDDSRTLQDKVKLWRKLQLRQPTTHSRAMRARSDWQGFDRITEIARGRMQSRDSIVTQNGKQRLLALVPAGTRRETSWPARSATWKTKMAGRPPGPGRNPAVKRRIR